MLYGRMYRDGTSGPSQFAVFDTLEEAKSGAKNGASMRLTVHGPIYEVTGRVWIPKVHSTLEWVEKK